MLSLDFGPRMLWKPFCMEAEWDQAWVEASQYPQLKRLWERMLCADLDLLRAEIAVAIENSLPWESMFFTTLLMLIPDDATELKVNR